MAGAVDYRLEGEAVQRATTALADLDRLLWKMTWDIARFDHAMLEPEDVHSELVMELARICAHPKYATLDMGELKSLIVVSCRNRINDMRTLYYRTHRRAEWKMDELDTTDSAGDDTDESGARQPVAIGAVTHDFSESAFLDGLSPDARTLVMEVLHPSEATMFQLGLAAKRKKQVYKGAMWTLTITANILMRSLGWDLVRTSAAWKEVKKYLRTS